MKTEGILDRLEDAVMLRSDDAAIRIHATYQPQAGAKAKVFPPTYLPDGETKYHFEERWGDDGETVSVVVLDSIQSQANRCERALDREADRLGLPRLLLRAALKERDVEISVLEAPHRSRDAYFIDSQIDGTPFDATEIGRALNSVTAKDATAALRYAPYDLVYGVWDSHRNRRVPTKFPRSYSSEMLGWEAVPGKRAATKGDPLNLPGTQGVVRSEWRPNDEGGKKKPVLNELGHGMIPGQPSGEAGGVSVRKITRAGVLSLTALAALKFPVSSGDANAAGRVALAALALAADRLAFAGAGLHLRSGADLVRVSDTLSWVRAGTEPEPFELTREAALDMLERARQRLADAGVEWSGDPVVVEPSEKLREVMEQAFFVPEQTQTE